MTRHSLGSISHYDWFVTRKAVERQHLFLKAGSVFTERIEHSRVLFKFRIEILKFSVKVGLESIQFCPVYFTINVFFNLSMSLLPCVFLELVTDICNYLLSNVSYPLPQMFV